MTVVTNVRLRPADDHHRRIGIRWWVSLTVNGIQVRGITVRKTKGGYPVICYPEDRSRRRRQPIPIVRPANAEVRRAIEGAIVTELAWLTREEE